MPLTRRHFLKVSSAGLLSVAGLPLNANNGQLPSAPDTFDLGSLPLLPAPDTSDLGLRLVPRIIVMGVGGAGLSVVSALMKDNMAEVTHLCVCTDERAMEYQDADLKLLIGQRATHGLGCGARPEYGRRAIDESQDQVLEILDSADLVLVLGGMGGGTATGAAPVLAQLAQEVGALTVGVVTQPFGFEGRRRKLQAAAGISALAEQADTTVVVPMDRMLNMVGSDSTLHQVYKQLDQVIGDVTRAIINMIMVPGLINVTFSDLRAVLRDGGRSAVGIGVGRGQDRVVEAAQAALQCPLLGDAKIGRASGMLVDITGDEVTIWELQDLMHIISRSLNDEALVSFGDTPGPGMQDEVRVTLIATETGSATAAPNSLVRNNEALLRK